MSQVGIITSVMHKFTPKGQELVLKTLKENKTLLAKDWGFTNFPQVISESGMTQNFERELLDKNSSIINLIFNLTNIITSKLFKNSTLVSTNKKIIDNVFKSLDINPRGKRIYEIQKHFETKKQKVLELLKSNKCKIAYYQFKECKSPEDIDKIVDTFLNLESSYIISNPFTILMGYLKKHRKLKRNLMSKKFHGLGIEIQKILLSPSKDKRVKNIEKILKQKYGFNYTNLNNYEDAKNILETVKFASEHNIPLSKNIIVTPFMLSEKSGFNILVKDTILINSNRQLSLFSASLNNANFESQNKKILYGMMKQFMIKNYSSPNRKAITLHEFIHNENRDGKRLPMLSEKYRSTIENIGEYAKSNFNTDNEEVRTELRVKQLLDYLKDDEQEVLNILQAYLKNY